MKIRKIYVSSFGKLKNYSLNLSDGFNEINEKNGWGKTTLATFIKCVFYGIDSGRKSLSQSERKKYKPWNTTEKFGGYIEFSWGENEYKIERYFGDKESDDTVKLFDLKTGRESTKTENLGKRLFSIDEEGFAASVYFSQNNQEGDVSTGLIEKFNSTYSKESGDFDKAYSRVDQTLKEYKIRGDKGKIPALKQRIYELNEEISIAKKAQETYFSVENDVKTLKNRCDELKKEIDVYSDKIESAGSAEALKIKKERFNAAFSRLNKLKTELNEKQKFFKNGIPDDKELEGYANCFKELNSVNEKINSLKNTLAYLKNGNISKEREKKNNNPLNLLLFIISIVSAILGGVFISGVPVLGITLFLSAFVCFSVGLIMINNGKKNKNNAVIYDEISKRENELSEYEKIAAVYENKLNDFFAGFNVKDGIVSAYSDNFYQIKTALSDIMTLNGYIKDAEKEYGLLREDKDVFIAAPAPTYNLEEIKIKAAAIRNEYDVKTRELAVKMSDLKSLDEKASKLSDLENAFDGTKEDLKTAELEYEILNNTKEFLSAANDAIIGKYRAPMEESFVKYLSYIDGKNDYGGAIDVDLKLSIIDGEKNYDTAYYSKGYRDLFELCKRFAFIDVLFTGEKPFILLDDPFSNLDGDKIVAGINFLQKISDEYQIIYFICHDSRSSKN